MGSDVWRGGSIMGSAVGLAGLAGLAGLVCTRRLGTIGEKKRKETLESDAGRRTHKLVPFFDFVGYLDVSR